MKNINLKTKMLIKTLSVPKHPPLNSRGGMREYTSGAGAGKGGGAGGSIKEAGGGLGKYGVAQEEGYFFNLAREQLKKLKDMVKTDEQPKAKAEKK